MVEKFSFTYYNTVMFIFEIIIAVSKPEAKIKWLLNFQLLKLSNVDKIHG